MSKLHGLAAFGAAPSAPQTPQESLVAPRAIVALARLHATVLVQFTSITGGIDLSNQWRTRFL
ncbi:Pathogenesis-related thaumatin superfamily protein [Prunus dulcis]|uniref:Pathogenesis-related thaumatin superfamily protein n=1 Tax=Prunus dulcis TaxID=3755 RepID=A0A5H2XLL0_PRUDU|nr:Pathogenesis-related thaumatin superfamily protein [Prunus dulcis]